MRDNARCSKKGERHERVMTKQAVPGGGGFTRLPPAGVGRELSLAGRREHSGSAFIGVAAPCRELSSCCRPSYMRLELLKCVVG